MRIPDHLTYLPRNPYAGHETCTASVFPLKCASNIRISQRHEVRIMPLVGELVLWNITWSPHFRQLLPVSSNKFRSELQGMKIRCPSLEAVSRQSQHLAVNLPNCLTVLKPSMTFQGHLYQPAVALQSPSCVQLFVTPWTVACQAFLPFIVSQSWLKLMSTELVMSFSHPLSPSSSPALMLLPASGSFPLSQFFASGGQSIGVWASASASVLPMNIQSWSPLGLTSLFS